MNRSFQQNILASILFNIAGATTLCIGIAIMYRWLTNQPLFFQIDLNYQPIPNGAVAFILAGLIFLSFNFSQSWITQILNFFLFLFGALSLIEYLFNIDLRIDSLLWKAKVFSQNIPSGRIPSGAAFCFTLLSIGVFLTKDKQRSRLLATFVHLLGTVISAMGLVSLIRYLDGSHENNGLIHLIPMAMPGAICFTLLGLGLIAYEMQSEKKEQSIIPFWLAPAVGVFYLVVTLSLTQSVFTKDKISTQVRIEAELEQASANIKRVVQAHLLSLERLKSQWENNSIHNQQEWDKLASFYIQGDDDIAIAMLSSSSEVIWTAPNQYKNALIKSKLPGVLQKQSRHKFSIILVEGLLRDVPEMMLIAPIKMLDNSQGLLISLLDIPILLDHLFNQQLHPGYYAEVTSGKKTLFATQAEKLGYKDDFNGKTQFSLGDLNWTITIWKDPAITNDTQELWMKIFTIGVLLMAVLSVFLMHYTGQAYFRSKQVSQINQELKEEIKQHKEAAIALLESRAENQAILDHLSDSILTIDSAGIIRSCNKATSAIFGYEESELKGARFSFLLSKASQDYFEHFLTNYYKEITPRIDQQPSSLHGKRKSRQIFPLDLVIAPMKLKNEYLLTFLMRDATERVKNEKLLLKSRKDLERSKEAIEQTSNAKSDFVASMSHEIRTPLHAILGMVDLLSSSPLNAEQTQFVKVCESAGNHLLEIVNDILDFSKIEWETLDLTFENFNLHELIKKIHEQMIYHSQKKGIAFSYNIFPEVAVYVRGDPYHLKQILVNLISNAIKFTNKGQVSLSVEPNLHQTGGDFLLFNVQDSGIGIPLEKARQIFSLFFQADSSITKKYGGTGLGLAISKRLVEKMKGTIWFESEEGEGSTFHFAIPLPKTDLPTKQSRNSHPPVKTLHLLLASHYIPDRMILRKGIIPYTQFIAEASSSIETLSKLKEGLGSDAPYNMLIIDHSPPFLDGFQMMKEIKAIPELSSLIVIFYLSEIQPIDLVQIRELAIAEYLTRPIKLDEFRRILSKYIEPPFLASATSASVLQTSKPQEVVENVSVFRVLVAEDSSDNFTLLQFYLKKEKYSLDWAENGLLAVEKFQKNSYDLVLMDIQMPIMDGYQAALLIRKWEKENQKIATPIIALTAFALPDDVQKALNAGCNEHLSKPIKKGPLNEAIERLLHKKEKSS